MEDQLNLFDYVPEWSLVTLDEKVEVLVPLSMESAFLDILRSLSGYIQVRRFKPVCGRCARIHVGAHKDIAHTHTCASPAHRPRPT